MIRVSDTSGSIPRGPLYRIAEFPRNQAPRGDKLQDEREVRQWTETRRYVWLDLR